MESNVLVELAYIYAPDLILLLFLGSDQNLGFVIPLARVVGRSLTILG